MIGKGLKVAALTTLESVLGGRMIGAMLEAGVTLDCVLLDPAPCSARERDIHALRTAGRLPPVPLEPLAAASGLALIQVAQHNDPAAVALVHERAIDLLVNAGTPRVVGPALLGAPGLGILNCHPGRLPDYRGSCAVEHAVLEDRPVANTVHLMSEGIDEGPVLTVREVDLAGVESYPDLRVATYEQGFVLLAECVAALQNGMATRADFQAQGEGRWHGPVDDHTMADVEARVALGHYTPLRKVPAA